MLNNVRLRLLNFNLYDSRSIDPSVHRLEIRSTRLFLLLLFISLLILTVYTCLILRLKSETIKQPSLIQYNELEKLYPNTLSCTCTKISILYNDFVTLTPIFHQVCSSDFIKQSWIDYTYGYNRTSLWPMDVRTTLSFMWQLIAALCQQSKVIVGLSVEDFQLTPLISSILLSRRLLDSKIQATIGNLRQLASGRLARPLTTVHQMTLINDFLTGVSTNHITSAAASKSPEELNLVHISSTKYLRRNSAQVCSCQSQGSCPIVGGLYLFDSWETQGFYDLNTIIADHILPGLVVDCLPIQMVFASTLECFYDRSCVDLLISSYSSSFDIAILDENISTRFQLNTTIKKLIDDLFIEIVMNETSFTAYYAACAPSLCTYTYERRFDWLYTITMITTLFGGLNVILKLISPYIIQFFQYIKRDKSTQRGISTKTKLNRLFQKALKAVREFNLFTKKSRNPLKIRRGRLSSRLFLISFVTAVVIFTTYKFFSIQILHEIIQSPTKDQYLDLYDRYGDILDCPCSTISMSYQDIIEIQPTYHQLCTTSYVQPWFYQYLDIYQNNFEMFGSFSSIMVSMRTLGTFCELASLITTDSIRNFYATNFMNSHAISQDRFLRETDALIGNLQNSTKTNFIYTMELIKTVLQANQYISGTACQNSVLFVMDSSLLGVALEPNTCQIISIDTGVSEGDGPACYCARERTCSQNAVANYFRSCSPIYFTLLNSWEFLYGESVLAELRQDLLSQNITLPPNVTILDPKLPSRFSLNASFQTIVDELTIENWNPSASFQQFYNICRPISCSFTYQARPSFLLIISATIGIIGGLNVLLGLICPFVVRMFVSNTEHTIPDTTNSLVPVRYPFLHKLIHRFRHCIITLNLFDSESDVVQTKRIERLSTWIYIILLSMSLTGFTIYAIWDTDMTVSHISISSVADYEKLADGVLQNLQCPCSQISVRYKDFISVTATFNQVCSSDFVQDAWIDFLFDNSFWFIYQRSDIRVRGAAYFTLLSSLCDLSRTVVESSIQQLLNETFINSYLISEADFRSKMKLILDGFVKQALLSFGSSLQVINSVTQSNSFISTYFLNWDWETLRSQSLHQVLAHPVVLNGGCSCATRHDCREPSGAFLAHDNVSIFTIPGFFISCSPMDTLLGSTLECFYSRQCLNRLIFSITLFGMSGEVDVNPLDPAVSSRFPNDAPLKDAIENLMIEEWETSVSYTSFYDQCAPSYCTHVTQIRSSLLAVLVRLLGIYGGIVSTFRIAVPFIVKAVSKIKNRRKKRMVISHQQN